MNSGKILLRDFVLESVTADEASLPQTRELQD